MNDKKVKQPVADMENVVVVWTEDQTSHNIPFSQRLIQSRALTLCNSMKAERDEEAAKVQFSAEDVEGRKYSVQHKRAR